MLYASRLFCGTLAASHRCVPSMASTATSVSDERRLLRGVLTEALDAQQRKRLALEEQLERHAAAPLAEVPSTADERKALAKAARALEALPQRLKDTDAASERLSELLGSLRGRANLAALRSDVEQMGLGGRLQTFDVDTMAFRQFGRPDGFDGLVINSPRGVPILVAQQSFKDGLLRRVSRGSDLWFQVREGRGSRVLLRTSMLPNLTRSPRECMEMAADCAAFFSDWRHSADDVEVIFTDPRHVAKRGTRVGQMKDSKRLGIIRALPQRVKHECRDAQEEQGWL